jgi:activator of HSP90 ATPase
VIKVDKIDGEAAINVRKGKRLLYYDMKIEGSWEGKTADGKTGRGKVNFPNVSEDVDDRLFEGLSNKKDYFFLYSEIFS